MYVFVYLDAIYYYEDAENNKSHNSSDAVKEYINDIPKTLVNSLWYA